MNILDENSVFVFGSNLAGIHGAGAAKTAVERFGAVYGQGVGPQGKSYAIPTKDRDIQTLPLNVIGKYFHDFILYAQCHREKTFYLTDIGCGLAGYEPKDIVPFLRGGPSNIVISTTFANVEGYETLRLRHRTYEGML